MVYHQDANRDIGLAEGTVGSVATHNRRIVVCPRSEAACIKLRSQPVYVPESGSLYQDRPQLLRDGKPVDYQSFRQSIIQLAEKDKICDEENLPEQVMLRPNEPTVVDWFILAEGATSVDDNAWYESLQPGKYTLSNRRRLNACDGPLMETNTISFVVVP